MALTDPGCLTQQDLLWIRQVLSKFDRWYSPARHMSARTVSVPASQAIKAFDANVARVGMSFQPPSTSTVNLFMGDSNAVTSVASGGMAGFPILPGEDWVFGPEYVGEVWFFATVAMDVRCLELISIPGALPQTF